MLLQTNSYIVPKEKRDEHARLLHRFRQTLSRLGCDHFESYEQVGVRWGEDQGNGRFVQLMRFRDRSHQQAVEAAERSDPTAQALIREFCELVNLPYQQQQGLFAVGFYKGVLSPVFRTRPGAEAAPVVAAGDNTPIAQPVAPRRVGFVPPPPAVRPAVPPPIAASEPEAPQPQPADPEAPMTADAAEDVAIDAWLGAPEANGDSARDAEQDSPAEPAADEFLTGQGDLGAEQEQHR